MHVRMRWVYLAGVLLLSSIGPVMLPLPATAQIMHDDGMQIPWFRSKADKLARQACENDLPECRDSIRKQLATEKAITRYIPWILICLCLLGAARYARKREEERNRQKAEAARHHIRASLREQNERKPDRDDDDEDDVDDRLGMGTPGDKRRR